ncbi:hypothetical protein OXYTRIMIC_671 [Oxytricha trifallax]|uniref:Uncharacterized protein n=1 Tax=Oxytricha trifallax TaxID=1172189 RepID=A0A073I0Z0_9SPIT|nr:hypothetical protein OXYTRIMIC_671 [Oxytricha trifallax]
MMSNCPNSESCNENQPCSVCRAKINNRYFSSSENQIQQSQQQASERVAIGQQLVDQNQQNPNQNPLANQLVQNPPQQDQMQGQNPPIIQAPPNNQNLNQPPPQIQPMIQQNPPRNHQQINQIQQFINFKLDIFPQNRFSISQNPSMITHLYSLNYDKLFQNVVKFSQYLIKTEYYEKNTISQSNSTDLNDIQNIQKMSLKRPNKFNQFFHALNIIMSSTYFICNEQAIQHSIVNLRKPDILALALSRNKMFDVDNFAGFIHDSTFQNFKLQKFECKTKYELLDQSKLEGKLLQFLSNLNVSPILIWTVDNENQEFIVIKQNQGDWFYLNRDSLTYKITKDPKSYVSDLADSIEELNQHDFIKDFFGAVNIFYQVQVCNSNDRKIDKTLHNMFHLIYDQRNYPQATQFWTSFKSLAEQQLKLPEIQNNKFALPPLKVNPTNSFSFQNTQNQGKAQKKRQAKNSKKLESDSQDTYDEATSSSNSSTPIKMKTRKQAAEEDELLKKRPRKG